MHAPSDCLRHLLVTHVTGFQIGGRGLQRHRQAHHAHERAAGGAHRAGWAAASDQGQHRVLSAFIALPHEHDPGPLVQAVVVAIASSCICLYKQEEQKKLQEKGEHNWWGGFNLAVTVVVSLIFTVGLNIYLLL